MRIHPVLHYTDAFDGSATSNLCTQSEDQAACVGIIFSHLDQTYLTARSQKIWPSQKIVSEKRVLTVIKTMKKESIREREVSSSKVRRHHAACSIIVKDIRNTERCTEIYGRNTA